MKHEIFRRLSRCFGLRSNFISLVTSRSYFCARNKSIAGDVASRLLLFFGGAILWLALFAGGLSESRKHHLISQSFDLDFCRIIQISDTFSIVHRDNS